MIKKKPLIIVYIYILIFFSISFFDLIILRDGVFKYVRFLFLLFTILISIASFFKYNGGFVFPIKLIICAQVFSIIMAYYSWGQSFSHSTIALSGYLLWPFFFFLKDYRVSIISIEKIVVVYSVVYIIVYFFQYLNVDTVYFGWQDEIELSRGVRRFILNGLGGLIYAIFLALNKITSNKNKNTIWYLLIAIGVTVILLQATRQTIGAIFVLILFHIIKEYSFLKKSIIIVSLIIGFFIIKNVQNSLVIGLIETQKSTMEQGEDYIRVLSAEFFLTEFSPNNVSRAFGNGVPYGTKSEYGKYVSELNEFSHFYMEDVGVIAVYAMFGLIAILGFILLWVKSFKIKLPKNFKYLKYYLWYLLLTFFTSDYAYSDSFLIFTVLAIYSFDTIHKHQNKILALHRKHK